jgi:hypothetical protein
MARVELRLVNGCTLENLPPVCMYCGDPVEKFCAVKMQHGDRMFQAYLPLCQDDRRGYLADLHTRLGNAFRAGAGHGLIGAGLWVAGEVMQASRANDKAIPVDGVSPEFVRALKAFRKAELEEFERNLVGGPPAKKKAPQDAGAAAFAELADDDPGSSPSDRAARQGRRGGGPALVVALAVVGVLLLLVGAVVALAILRVL